jgi:alkylhydroperoxidase/carboxymuconolactone decarboxylase family protein YurZ
MTVDGRKLLEEMRAERGYLLPAHEVLAERDPEFLDAYNRMFMAANSDRSPLPPDVRELMLVALDIAAGVKPEVVASHARKAVEHGATEAQVVAAVELAVLVFASRNLGPLATIFQKEGRPG